jgi:2-polyprenyl-3-methyl-5-hydroxy-6-metoxy-1,4-benzoquinol methylase
MAVSGARCRFCDAPLHFTFVDLGMSPLCQTVIAEDQTSEMERFYPLHAYVCGECFLVQVEEIVPPDEIFSDYPYLSSYSDSWVEHARQYVEMISDRLGLGPESQVVEIASNDGYLLQHFVAKGVPCLGVEPAANVAEIARAKGIDSEVCFFGEESAKRIAAEHRKADLILGNNVLAHVPNIHDFVQGLNELLADTGTVTMEFPHLLKLMQLNQFDTIYHEHFSYLAFFVVEKIFANHGLTLYDVDEIPTHGGSIRIYARHTEDDTKPVSEAVEKLRNKEFEAGLDRLETYAGFTEQVKETKRALLDFLIRTHREGKTVVGYGAPGKGITLLNYCGIREDFMGYTVDRNPLKQGHYTPGTHIPIFPPEKIRETKPDYVLILPWNLKDEIASQHAYIAEWGGRFVVPIPRVEVL